MLLLTGDGRAYEVLHFLMGAPTTRELTEETRNVEADDTGDDDETKDVEMDVVSVKCGLSTYSLGLAR